MSSDTHARWAGADQSWGMSHLPPYPVTDQRSRPSGRGRLLLFGALIALLAAVAGTGILVTVWRSIWLSISFEPSDTARFQASVGESLGIAATVALALLVSAVIIARPWRLRGAGALVSSLVAVAGSMTVTGLVLRSAEHRLHPSLSVERAAIHAYPLPSRAGEPDTTTSILDHPQITVIWTIHGDQTTICARAIASFNRWANPGTVHTPARPLLPNDRVGQHGPDHAQLSCVAAPSTHTPVSLTLQLTRA